MQDKRSQLNDLLILYSSALVKSDLAHIPSVKAFIKKFVFGHSRPCEMHLYTRRAWLDSNKAIISVWDTVNPPNARMNFHTHRSSQTLSYSFDFFGLEKDQCLASLYKSGYYVFQSRLPQDLVVQFLEKLSCAGLSPELNGQKRSEDLVSRRDALGNGDLSSLRYFYSKKAIESSELVASVINSPAILDIVSQYLNGKSFVSSCAGWLSVGNDKRDLVLQSNSAQEYHFDFDALRFLKVFVYLSDVDRSLGAHEYVASSHHPFPTNQSYRFPEYFRASKTQLSSLYQEDNFRTLEGSMGTVIIEDTSGFHRGRPLPPKCSRDILVIQYRDTDIPSLAYGAI